MQIKPQKNNVAFIDGQNLNLGTVKNENGSWHIDYAKFRQYLTDKYAVKDAYYYLGCIRPTEQDLYTKLQKSGFILKFRDHNELMITKKKGNVDSDIIFDVMRGLNDGDIEGKVILVSGDGDYHRMAKYLLKINKLGHILFPNGQFASGLYKNIGIDNRSALDETDVRNKIEYVKKTSK